MRAHRDAETIRTAATPAGRRSVAAAPAILSMAGNGAVNAGGIAPAFRRRRAARFAAISSATPTLTVPAAESMTRRSTTAITTATRRAWMTGATDAISIRRVIHGIDPPIGTTTRDTAHARRTQICTARDSEAGTSRALATANGTATRTTP